MHLAPSALHRPTAYLLLCLACPLLAGCASKLAGGMREDGSLAHAATTPLRDVGLVRPLVPEALQHMRYPYSLTHPPADCAAITAEILALDGMLGEESYQPGEAKSLAARAGGEAGDYAVSSLANAAADALPYRAWVRRLSGASAAERKAATAYLYGEQRRTFLRGYAAGLACPLPLPAPPVSDKSEKDRGA